MRLLIVDDEYFARQGIMDGVNWDVLQLEEVLQAGSYSEAVDCFERLAEKKQGIDILLCDIEMPDESGLELIAWVNEHAPDTECIILSCHDEFDFARQAVQLRCQDYILKPVRYEFLTEVLARTMRIVAEKHRQSTLEGYGKIYIENIAQTRKEESADVVDQVVEYIEQHLSEELGVRQLANRVYVSPDHLTRSFKKRFGQTVSDYILQKRMTLAGELLRDRRMTVTMVSDCVGFGNYSYFTEQFKRYYGMTPREYQGAVGKEGKRE
ncbi:MAG: AraC family transcriptional regulator [Roseburia sp.]|nr:AraC family transcriptional regulator [Roseburia sp.]MCM1098589.1 AraC family transcriptional regulator [Ruminococcus flavefaciens]